MCLEVAIYRLDLRDFKLMSATLSDRQHTLSDSQTPTESGLLHTNPPGGGFVSPAAGLPCLLRVACLFWRSVGFVWSVSRAQDLPSFPQVHAYKVRITILCAFFARGEFHRDGFCGFSQIFLNAYT